MSRIFTNVSSLVAQRILGQTNNALTTSLERLSTGLAINRGKDNPAGLIASENLRAEKAAISSAIANGERADQVINIAEGGLTEIASLLTDLQGLVTATANDAGTSLEEKQANQSEIDSILASIDRIANSNNFQGTKLLNGTFDYTIANQTSTEISDVQVNAAAIPSGGQISVTVDVIQSAQTGVAFLSGAGGGGGTLDTNDTGPLTIEIAGNKGTQSLSFASGATLTNVVTGINDFSGVTGVSASLSGGIILLNSQEFGGDQFASVSVIDGTTGISGGTYAANNGTADIKDTGRNATLTINGQNAQVSGLVGRVASSSLDVEVTLAAAHNVDGNQSTFDITGGGATFQISPEVNLGGQANIGIQSVTSGNLGLAAARLTTLKSGGAQNVVDGDLTQAQAVVAKAIKQISSLRGRLGSFQKNTLQSMIRQLGVTLENTAAAESQIRDTDFAAETANLTRSQILSQAATSALALANQQPASVLALLA